jgi:hypothetical protein
MPMVFTNKDRTLSASIPARAIVELITKASTSTAEA